MIALVEGAEAPADAQRDRALDPAGGPDDRLPAGGRDARPFAHLRRRRTVSTVILVALLVCLIPTTIGGLLSAIGIAGMDRVTRFNVLAMSGRAVEAAGDVDVLLLDKTGTITYGNRLAASIIPAPGVSEADVVDAALVVVDRATRRRRAARSSTSPGAPRRARAAGRRRRRRRLRRRSTRPTPR